MQSSQYSQSYVAKAIPVLTVYVSVYHIRIATSKTYKIKPKIIKKRLIEANNMFANTFCNIITYEGVMAFRPPK